MESLANTNGNFVEQIKVLKIELEMERAKKRSEDENCQIGYLRVSPMNEQHFGIKRSMNNKGNWYQGKVNTGWVHPKPKSHRRNYRQGNHVQNRGNSNHRLRTIENFEGRNGLRNFGMKPNGFEYKNIGMKANWKKKGRFRNGIDPEVERWFEKRMSNWEKLKLAQKFVNESSKGGSMLNFDLAENGGKRNEGRLETDRYDRPMSDADAIKEAEVDEYFEKVAQSIQSKRENNGSERKI